MQQCVAIFPYPVEDRSTAKLKLREIMHPYYYMQSRKAVCIYNLLSALPRIKRFSCLLFTVHASPVMIHTSNHKKFIIPQQVID